MKDKLLASGLAAGRRLLGNSPTQAFSRDGLNLSRHLLSLLTLSDMSWLQIGNLIDIGVPILACALCLRQAIVRDPGGAPGVQPFAGLPVGPASDQPALG